MIEFEIDEIRQYVSLPTNCELLRSSNGKNLNPEKVSFAFVFGVHNHPPPPAPLVTLHKRQFFAYKATVSPQAKPVMIKVRTQARMTEEGLDEVGRSSIEREGVYVMGRSALESKKYISIS